MTNTLLSVLSFIALSIFVLLYPGNELLFKIDVVDPVSMRHLIL